MDQRNEIENDAPVKDGAFYLNGLEELDGSWDLNTEKVMTVTMALQNYIKEASWMTVLPVANYIDKELKEKEIINSGCLLAPMETGETLVNILGDRTFQTTYVFFASKAELGENQELCCDLVEIFSEWLEDRKEADKLPELPEPLILDEIRVADGKLLTFDDEGNGVYQVQIQLSYTKRKKGEQ